MAKTAETKSQDRKKRHIHISACRALSGGDKGQALVEVALVISLILLPIIVGAAELGRLSYATIEVTNAARAGVAYGAQNPTTAADLAGMETAATNDGSNVTTMTATAQSLCACSNAPTATSACSSTFSCTGANRILQYVQVNTTAPVGTLFHYPGIPSTLTFRGQAIMRVEE